MTRTDVKPAHAAGGSGAERAAVRGYIILDYIDRARKNVEENPVPAEVMVNAVIIPEPKVGVIITPLPLPPPETVICVFTSIYLVPPTKLVVFTNYNTRSNNN